MSTCFSVVRLGIATLVLTSGIVLPGWAQVTTSPPENNAAFAPSSARALSDVQRPHYIELEKRLRPVVEEASPAARVTRSDSAITIVCRRDDVTDHLVGAEGGFVTNDPEIAAGAATEFAIRIDFRKGTRMHPGRPRSQSSFQYGKSVWDRFNIRPLAPDEVGERPSVWQAVESDFWPHTFVNYLFNRGLSMPGWSDCMGSCGYRTRFEYAAFVAKHLEVVKLRDRRLTPEEKALKQRMKALMQDAAVRTGFEQMQREFAHELKDLGFESHTVRTALKDNYTPRLFEFIGIDITSGTEANQRLLSRVHSVVKEYSAEVWRRNTGSTHEIEPPEDDLVQVFRP